MNTSAASVQGLHIILCVIAELKKLGETFSGTLSVARKLDAAKCDHEPLKSASECLESFIGDGNPEHFCVATQDAELRIKLRQVPAVAILLAQNNFLVLEPPSEKQQAIARANEAQRTHASKREFQIFEARERKKKALLAAKGGENDAGTATNEEPNNSGFRSFDSFKTSSETTSHRRKSILAQDHPRFKKKRAKGPNPLSCKKKIKKPAKPEAKPQRLLGDGEKHGTLEGVTKHKRKKVL
ncbi:hypothetical protein L7F22_022624 [Adiantum nelumboides]|nr:hypothetical protein [Adiantum nelumboides]